MVTKGRAVVEARFEDLRVIRSPIVSPATMCPRAGVAGMSGVFRPPRGKDSTAGGKQQ